MPREIWLQPNRRGLCFAAIPAVILLPLAAALISWNSSLGMAVTGYTLMTAAFLIIAMVVVTARQPRLAYGDGFLLVYLRHGAPLRVPIDVVECFFLGQGPSIIRHGSSSTAKSVESVNIIVRLAEAATEWKRADVNPLFGLWCDGYITIRGAWCEPIRPELVEELNRKLVSIHRERKAKKGAVAE